MRCSWRARATAYVRALFLLPVAVGGAGCASRPRGHADEIGRHAAGSGAVDVTLVSDEADAALALLRKRRAGTPPDTGDWARLFGTRGYRRLKTRELGMRRAFTDSAFRAFVLSDSLLARLPALEAALADYRSLDVGAQAARALRYLPPGATVHATLYLTIKPRTNTFVWADSAERSVVLYVDPARPRAAVEYDVVAHELHHISYAETCDAGAPARAPDTTPATAAAARADLGGARLARRLR